MALAVNRSHCSLQDVLRLRYELLSKGLTNIGQSVSLFALHPAKISNTDLARPSSPR